MFCRNFSSQYVSAFVFTPAYLTAEIVRTGLLMIPNIVIGFIIMCIFASTTVTISAVFMLQMNNRKVLFNSKVKIDFKNFFKIKNLKKFKQY